MNLTLKRGIEVIVGAALIVVMLAAVLPTVAQEEDAAPARVVVSHGDTLWSISEEHLGPQATPRQIASEVERIYALNRDRIGHDPDLIASGHELSLPMMGISPADELTTKKKLAQAAMGTTQGGRTVNGQTSEQQASLPNLPKVPALVAAPTIESLALDAPPTALPVASSPSTVRSAASSVVAASVGILTEAKTTADGRRLLGWTIIALTVLAGILMAWKLPIRRNTGYEKEMMWGIYAGYPAGGYYADSSQAFELRSRSSGVQRPTALDIGLEPSANGSKAQSTVTEKGASPVGLGGTVQKRRRQLPRRTSSKRPLHKKSRRRPATKAHGGDARRLLRGAELRPRAAREPRRSSGRIETARRAASGGGR